MLEYPKQNYQAFQQLGLCLVLCSVLFFSAHTFVWMSAVKKTLTEKTEVYMTLTYLIKY